MEGTVQKLIKLLITFFTFFVIALGLASSMKAHADIDLDKFRKPFCMIGKGKYNASRRYKVRKLKKYQRRISRKIRHFSRNRQLEMKGKLFGSPKWVVKRYLGKRGKNFNKQEVDFAFFVMTLFGEARSLNEKEIEMVAKVINNRKGNMSYENVVTDLAQFSTWYYKNNHDNVVLLCPRTNQFSNWRRVLKVAYKTFNVKETKFKSTQYFSPYNMVPRYRIPKWAKGKYVVAHGGHVFIVSKQYAKELGNKAFYISRKAKKVKLHKGRVISYF